MGETKTGSEEAEKLAAAGEKNLADISRGEDFTSDPKKSLFRYIEVHYKKGVLKNFAKFT